MASPASNSAIGFIGPMEKKIFIKPQEETPR
jgi:hypothetical protein